MIQDIYPKKYDNTYKNIEPSSGDYVLIYDGGEAVFKNDRREFFTYDDTERLFGYLPSLSYIYLFSIDDARFFLLSGADVSGFKDRIRHIQFREFEPQWLGFAGICGANLAKWYGSVKYCGRCGERTEHSNTERAMVCPECGSIYYPVICPAVIVAVINGDKILMTKYAYGTYRKYALVAGYTEIGETLERTVEREVLEEVGLKVKNIRYYASQPWPFSGTELMGFIAEVDGNDEVTLDTSELAEAKWFGRDEIMEEENPKSLTNTLIQAFRRGEI